jgi:inhibitor of KinA sporulation pathway (predicted exonuclease)
VNKSKKDKVQFIDVEQLCWNNNNVPEGQLRDIIQIGIVEIDNTNLTISREFSYYIRPNKVFEVSEYCTNLTGITYSDLINNGRYYPEIIKTIEKNVGPSSKTTWAWGNDNGTISEECQKYGILNPWNNKIQDFGIVFRNLSGINKKMALEMALKKYNIDFKGDAHDALNDARALAELYIEFSKRIRKNN